MANNNSGADALIGRILADAQAEADAALADADKEAERIALIAKDERFRIENETAQKTKRLNDAAQFLGLGQGGANSFVRNERAGHVAKHGSTVSRSTVELAIAVMVTHF